MNRTLILGAAIWLTTTPPSGAQVDCDDPAIRPVSGTPALAGFRLLFQQNGVTFYGRVPAGQAPQAAEVIIRNGNAQAVEVSYSVLLDVTGDSLPRSVSIGRHCAQIPPRQYVISTDSTPAPAAGVRVRNLTIANLLAPLPLRRDSSPKPGTAVGGPLTGAAQAPVAPSPETVSPSGAAAAGEATATAMADASLPPDVDRPRPPRRPRLWAPIRPGSTVVDWALEATYAVFYLLSATILVIAGLGLVLPVLGAFALLLLLGGRALFGRRGAPPGSA